MPSTATVTGKVGPAGTLTAGVFQVVSFQVETESEILTLVTTDRRTLQIDIAAATTITCTVSGNSYTLTIS